MLKESHLLVKNV